MAWIDGVLFLYLIAWLIIQVLATLMIAARVDCKDLCVDILYLYLWLRSWIAKKKCNRFMPDKMLRHMLFILLY